MGLINPYKLGYCHGTLIILYFHPAHKRGMKLAPGTEFSTKTHQTTCDPIHPGWNEEEMMRRFHVLLNPHLFMNVNIIFTGTMIPISGKICLHLVRVAEAGAAPSACWHKPLDSSKNNDAIQSVHLRALYNINTCSSILYFVWFPLAVFNCGLYRRFLLKARSTDVSININYWRNAEKISSKNLHKHIFIPRLYLRSMNPKDDKLKFPTRGKSVHVTPNVF